MVPIFLVNDIPSSAKEKIFLVSRFYTFLIKKFRTVTILYKFVDVELGIFLMSLSNNLYGGYQRA